MCQILIIEDNANQRLLYEQELADEGYRDILTASNGQEGLNLFKLHQPGLVILDILIPGMDGILVMEKMLTIDPQTSIIVHSAYSSPSHDFVTWHAKAYIVKSGDLKLLLEQVRAVIVGNVSKP